MPIKTAEKITKKIRRRLTVHKRKIVKHAKDHFIPHKGNGHHPHVLKHHVLFGYSAIIVLLKVLVIAVSVTFPKTQIQAMALTATNILSLVNQARSAASLPALQLDSRLMVSAKDKAQDMMANQYFSHYSPSGVSPWYWIKRAGYKYLKSAENLAVHYTSTEGVQDAWMSSPEHRKNILNPEFKDIGIGFAQGSFEGADTTFVVQHFGKPYEEPITQTEEASTGTVVIAAQSKSEMDTYIASAPPPPQPAPTKAPQEASVKAPDVPSKTIPLPAKAVAVATRAPVAQSISKPSLDGSTTTSSVMANLQGQDEPPDWSQDMFRAPNSPKNEKLFGLLDAENAGPFSHIIYAFMAVFIAFAVSLGLVHKLHLKKPEAMAHALGVLGLIVIFWAI